MYTILLCTLSVIILVKCTPVPYTGKVGRVYVKCDDFIQYRYTVHLDSTALSDTLYIIERDGLKTNVLWRIPIEDQD